MGHKSLIEQKYRDLKFELEEKLDHYFMVKFRSKSNGDSLDAQQCLDPEMAHEGLIRCS